VIKRSSATSNVGPHVAGGENTARDWFLRDSYWQDAVWILAPTNVQEENRPVRIRWDFSLPSGRCFTDARYASLLESAKKLVALIRRRSMSASLASRARTVDGYFLYLRELIRWMDQEGFARFADLDATAILQFQGSIQRRKGSGRSTLSPTTVQKYLILLVYLYRYRGKVGDGLMMDPFPGQSPGVAARVRGHFGRLPYTPDAVAVPLIQGSIEFLSSCAIDILRAREIYTTAIHKAQQRGLRDEACNNAATRALRQVTLRIAGKAHPIDSLDDLAPLIDFTYAACFVVISYLVGPRAGEILHLQAGCVRSLSANGSVNDASVGDTGIAVIVGAIFKHEGEYYGRPHEWVAPPPALHAITVLEALSAPHRARTGRKQLWLRAWTSPGFVDT
jgi:hypothetical protein